MNQDNVETSNYDLFKINLGKELCELLHNTDGEIEEIMRNPDGECWIIKKGAGEVCLGNLQNDVAARNTIEIVASSMRVTCDRKRPTLIGEIPVLKYRFTGILPEPAEKPMWSIRIPSPRIYTLEDYEKSLVMTPQQTQMLKKWLDDRQNILIIGSTNSGKTTLTNACLHYTSKYNERHVLIEDTRELRCSARNKALLRAGDYASIEQLIAVTMRLTPKRIVVGEARTGVVAQVLIEACNTGHKGVMCTIHANSALDGLYRVGELIRQVQNLVPEEIARAINAVIFIQAAQDSSWRRVTEMALVKGYSGEFQLDYIKED